MNIAVETWTFSTEGDEEPTKGECVECREFDFEEGWEARAYAWDRLEEGFFVRIWRR